MSKGFIGFSTAAAIMALALLAPAAQADVFTSTLNVPNSAISGFPGPYGTLTITTTSPTTATVLFTANSGFLFGDGGSVDLQVNAASFTETNVVLTGASGTGFNTPSCTMGGAACPAGSGQVDGFGVFNLTNNLYDGFTNAASQISFTLTNTSGTWANAASVVTLNANLFDAAAHIFVCATAACASTAGGAIATGFAGEGPGVPVSSPGTLALLGTGLAALGFIRRRRSV